MNLLIFSYFLVALFYPFKRITSYEFSEIKYYVELIRKILFATSFLILTPNFFIGSGAVILYILVIIKSPKIEKDFLCLIAGLSVYNPELLLISLLNLIVIYSLQDKTWRNFFAGYPEFLIGVAISLLVKVQYMGFHLF